MSSISIFQISLKKVGELPTSLFDEEISSSVMAAKIAHEYLKYIYHGDMPDREHLFVMYLSTKLRVCGFENISIGTLNTALVHPREVFKGAILNNAASVIIVHNHPSGDVNPSDADIQITQRLKEAGKILGIELLDHIILGFSGAYYSMSVQGQL